MDDAIKKIDSLIEQARKYDSEDNVVMAVSLYQQAADEFVKINDYNGAALAFTKAVQILKRESELYKAAMLLRKLGSLYEQKKGYLNAGRQFSRSGAMFKDVKEFQEAASSYNMAAEMFYKLEGGFYAEAGKHYKMATLCLINFYQHELAEYEKAFNNTLEAFKGAWQTGNISKKDYLLYIVNFYTDVEDALSRNGIYREESSMYIKKMDTIKEIARLDKKTWPRYVMMAIWDVTCSYGENIGRWLLWTVVDIAVFAFIHHSMKSVSNPQGQILSLPESFFFAVNFFTTNGFGGYTLLTPMAKFVAALNIISGVAMTAILITIIARKITR